ncbi:MAG: UDP-3-O-(3-hydroxymyristoyl)glucosamine N-acyltransferase [Candidatus Eremiobacteraeota bacterium]|nr:UDP-3-O-(3-hydroxymyristoyl)glucosamine N-acyltransferase [Candidatus Eremiobacteraeota bacterium]
MLGTLGEVAARLGGRVVGDASVIVTRVAAVDDAGADALTFATNETFFASALATDAAAILVEAAFADGASPKPLVVVENVRDALARLLGELKPSRPRGPFRHPSAAIEPDASLAADVYVGAHVYVGHRTVVESGAIIEAGAYVGDDVAIGESAWIHSRVSVMRGTYLGKRVVLHAGCVIGSDGFGWVFVGGQAERIPQIGNVVLEDDVEVGVNSCIDRAQTGSTRIGSGTKIDNLVQIGHNCRIGKHCVIASLTGLAGSTVIGDYVKVGGQVGFKGHVSVGSRVTIAGQSAIWSDIPDDVTVSGRPAHDHRDELRRKVMIRKLPKLFDRVEALERSRLQQ